MKKVLIITLIIFCIMFVAIRYSSLNSILGLPTSESSTREMIYYEDFEPEVEDEMINEIREKYHIYFVRESEYVGEKKNEILSALKENEVVTTVEDELFNNTIVFYYNAEIDENGNPIPVNSIETNHINRDRVLLSKSAYSSVLNGQTKANRIIEIAKEDKDVIYVATLDWISEIPLEEVPDNMHIKEFDTNTDKNGIIKCICYFVPNVD